MSLFQQYIGNFEVITDAIKFGTAVKVSAKDLAGYFLIGRYAYDTQNKLYGYMYVNNLFTMSKEDQEVSKDFFNQLKAEHKATRGASYIFEKTKLESHIVEKLDSILAKFEKKEASKMVKVDACIKNLVLAEEWEENARYALEKYPQKSKPLFAWCAKELRAAQDQFNSVIADLGAEELGKVTSMLENARKCKDYSEFRAEVDKWVAADEAAKQFEPVVATKATKKAKAAAVINKDAVCEDAVPAAVPEDAGATKGKKKKSKAARKAANAACAEVMTASTLVSANKMQAEIVNEPKEHESVVSGIPWARVVNPHAYAVMEAEKTAEAKRIAAEEKAAAEAEARRIAAEEKAAREKAEAESFQEVRKSAKKVSSGATGKGNISHRSFSDQRDRFSCAQANYAAAEQARNHGKETNEQVKKLGNEQVKQKDTKVTRREENIANLLVAIDNAKELVEDYPCEVNEILLARLEQQLNALLLKGNH